MEATKARVKEPSGQAREAYKNMADAEFFGKDRAAIVEQPKNTGCALDMCKKKY
jgi:hypothetical protein